MANLHVIKDLLLEKGMTIRTLAKQLGVTEQGLQKAIRTNSTKIETLERIASILNVPINTFFETNSFRQKLENVIHLPFYPIGAKSLTKNSNGFEFPDQISLFKREGVDYSQIKVIEVQDDTMEPTLISGAKVLLKKEPKTNWAYINSGVYVVIYDNKIAVKRIKENDLLLDGFLRLYSDNNYAGYFIVKNESIQEIYKVERVIDSIVK